jgi:hypothetical protein
MIPNDLVLSLMPTYDQHVSLALADHGIRVQQTHVFWRQPERADLT